MANDERTKEVLELYDQLRNHKGGVPLALIGGAWLHPVVPAIWPQIRNFPVRADDIFICSFYKTGTKMLKRLLYMVDTGSIDRPPAASPKNQQHRNSVFEMPLPPDPGQLERLAFDPQRRFINTHLPANLLPVHIFKSRAVIYLYRGVKDTVVAMYKTVHHYLDVARNPDVAYHGSFEDYARLFMTGEVLGGPYDKHLKGFLELVGKQEKPILFVRYEDLKNDPAGAIRGLSVFLERPLEDCIAEQIKEAFSSKKNCVGEWRQSFTDPELLAEFDNYVKSNYPMELFPDFE